jgi:VWFA-related protein
MKTMMVLLVIWTSSLSLAQQDYTVSVSRVTVWVKALDKNGNPVRGLKASDFEIYEDGRPVEINCFEEVVLTATATPQMSPSPSPSETPRTEAAGPPPEAADRVFAVLLDFYNTSQPEYLFIKPKLREFMDQISTYEFPVTVGVLLSSKRLGVVSPLTQDYQRVKKQLNRFRANAQRDQAMLYRKREIIRLLEMAQETPDDSIIQKAYALARNFTRQEKSESEFSLAALQSFANRISITNPGKHVVLLYVSGGVNSDPGRTYYDIIDRYMERVGDKADPSSITALQFSGIREDNFDLQGKIKKNIGKLNKRNISIYSINSRGMVTTDSGNVYQQTADFAFTDTQLLREYQDTLDQISRETGGVSFKNSLNFKHGFDSVISDLNHQYVICYSSPEHTKTGKYYEIKVKTSVPGVQLRHRRGYTE